MSRYDKRCPLCGRIMTYATTASFDNPVTTDRGEEIYQRTIHEEWFCAICGIFRKDGIWSVPENIPKATEEQIRQIRYINQSLGRHFEPVVYEQCKRIVDTYMAAATARR